jgi:hypothetical protein
MSYMGSRRGRKRRRKSAEDQAFEVRKKDQIRKVAARPSRFHIAFDRNGIVIFFFVLGFIFSFLID